MTDMIKAAGRRLAREPVLLWGAIYAVWTWQYPSASTAAVGAMTAIGVLFQRSLSKSKVQAQEDELAAVVIGANAKEAELARQQ